MAKIKKILMLGCGAIRLLYIGRTAGITTLGIILGFPIKLNIQVPYDAAFPPLGVYPRKKRNHMSTKRLEHECS